MADDAAAAVDVRGAAGDGRGCHDGDVREVRSGGIKEFEVGGFVWLGVEVFCVCSRSPIYEMGGFVRSSALDDVVFGCFVVESAV
jgi:hypothetical protein